MAVEIQNVDAVIEAIMKKGNTNKLLSAMNKACLMVEREAKQTAPKQTGNLRSSIATNVTESEGSITGMVGTPLQYAPYVEYGTGLFATKGNGRKDVPWCYQDAKGDWHTTSGQAPQPFLIPALNNNRQDIIAKFTEALK